MNKLCIDIAVLSIVCRGYYTRCIRIDLRPQLMKAVITRVSQVYGRTDRQELPGGEV